MPSTLNSVSPAESESVQQDPTLAPVESDSDTVEEEDGDTTRNGDDDDSVERTRH